MVDPIWHFDLLVDEVRANCLDFRCFCYECTIHNNLYTPRLGAIRRLCSGIGKKHNPVW